MGWTQQGVPDIPYKNIPPNSQNYNFIVISEYEIVISQSSLKYFFFIVHPRLVLEIWHYTDKSEWQYKQMTRNQKSKREEEALTKKGKVIHRTTIQQIHNPQLMRMPGKLQGFTIKGLCAFYWEHTVQAKFKD